jgi:hypothetical protein
MHFQVIFARESASQRAPMRMAQSADDMPNDLTIDTRRS